MFYIGIENYTKTCYIGLFSEEKKIPNTLQINVKIGKKDCTITDLPDWDYSILSSIIDKIIDEKSQHYLLEDILKSLVQKYQSTFNYDSIYILIKKLNPPTNENLKSSYVEWNENI